MRELAILGVGGTAIDIAEACEAAGSHRLAGFLDDDTQGAAARAAPYPLLGPLAAAARLPCDLLLAIGSVHSAARRADILGRLGLADARFARARHPAAAVSASAELGPGTAILSGAAIGARARLGAHVIILQNAVVGHDSQIGACAILAAGAVLAAHCTIGAGAYVGQGATLRGGVSVGPGAVVGMGAVVLEDVAPGSTVAGNPARPIRRA